MKKQKITQQDYLKAHRKASREEEIARHGRPARFRAVHKSKKAYDRKREKAGLRNLPFSFHIKIYSHSSPPACLRFGGLVQHMQTDDGLTLYFSAAKLLQKSEMRKNMVMDLIYRGFIYAANYSESHYNPRRSQIKTELRYLFVTTPNR